MRKKEDKICDRCGKPGATLHTFFDNGDHEYDGSWMNIMLCKECSAEVIKFMKKKKLEVEE